MASAKTLPTHSDRTPYSLGEPMAYDQQLSHTDTDSLVLHILDLEQRLVQKDQRLEEQRTELKVAQAQIKSQGDLVAAFRQAMTAEARALAALKGLYRKWAKDHPPTEDVGTMLHALEEALAARAAAPAVEVAWTPEDSQNVFKLTDYLVNNQYMPVDYKNQLKGLAERLVRIIHQVAGGSGQGTEEA